MKENINTLTQQLNQEKTDKNEQKLAHLQAVDALNQENLRLQKLILDKDQDELLASLKSEIDSLKM